MCLNEAHFGAETCVKKPHYYLYMHVFSEMLNQEWLMIAKTGLLELLRHTCHNKH